MDGFPAFAPELANGNDGFSADFFRHVAALEPGNFWFEGRNRLIQWGMQRHAGKAGNFLEVGCGSGFVLQSIRRGFPGTAVWGSEVFVEGLAFAAARLPGIPLIQMDAREIPFDSEFDAIGIFDVLEHVQEDEEVLAELKRALKPGGAVLITVPQHPMLWSAMDDFSFHKRRYTRSELNAKLLAAGFEILLMTSFVTLLLPAMLASRLGYRKGKTVAAGDALRIHPVLNRIFAAIVGWERTMIESGWRFPVGGSLFAIARRPSWGGTN
jgi:SAM-dependent methyltransferase